MSDWNPIYTFHLDDGEHKTTYADYLNNKELRALVEDGYPGRRPTYTHFYFGRSLVILSDKRLQDKAIANQLKEVQDAVAACPIAYFNPMGPDALDFLNDHSSDIAILRGGNQASKTATGIVKDLLDLIPCHKDWPIFKDFGVTYREWTQPRVAGFGIYKLGTIKKKIWKEIIKWCPPHQLGKYAPYYRGKGKKSVTWDRNPVLPFTCGSELEFFAYEQDDDVFASETLEFFHWDEQPPYAKWLEVDERVSYFPRHRVTMTPHKILGNPHTGAGSWVHQAEEGEASIAVSE